MMPFSGLFKEYAKESPSLSPYFSKFPSDLFKKEAIQRKEFIDRTQLYQLLQSFNEKLSLSDESKSNLKALSAENTFTVVTGQQIGLFGGHLYTVFKIITTILYAKKLSEHHGVKVVPVFWIADEDHDFDEANHVVLPVGDKTVKIEVERVSTVNKQVGREFLPGDIEEKIAAFFEASGQTEFSNELKGWISADFTSKTSQKDAFLKLINRIFGKYGLIFFGSDHKGVKEVSKPIIKKSIHDAELIYDALESQSKSIESVYHRQANTDISNLFLNTEKGRVKLQFDQSSKNWSTAEKEYSQSELLDLVDKSPEIFSPNVFLRPVIQEFVLPNLAYVAGPGEVAYYAQTKTFFESFSIEQPVIVPRLTATIIDKPFHRYWNELPIRFREYFQRIEDLETELVHRMQPIDLDAKFQQWIDEVQNVSNTYKQSISHIDGSLEQSVERAVNSFGNELQKLKGKVFKSLKQKDEVTLQRIRKIHASIYPNNQLQERLIGFSYYLNKYGTSCFDRILERDVIDDHKQHVLLFFE
ncbi:bacillithiol biosynthesis cysteine-adding enzyme BshC [bacterium]|nr:MAG: bacillithiol biosynthesis cysteine-adding enzyme BshC [bacterium]